MPSPTHLTLAQIDLLGRPLGTTLNDWQLTVLDGVFGTDDLSGDPVLRMTVSVIPAVDEPRQTWRLSLAVDADDVPPNVNLDAFLLIVRANLDEWWQTKDSKSPNLSVRGTRIE